jgi:hypothetical protein
VEGDYGSNLVQPCLLYIPFSFYGCAVARQAFEHAKNSAAILSDNEINSDGEPDDIEIENGTPIVKKRKSFFGFSAVATSHEKKKADGVTTETTAEKKQELTHVQEGDVDALKTHESENAVTHSTDAPSTPAEKPKPKNGGGFKLFGKKAPKAEEAPASPVEPLTVDEAKAQALKAVDDAVEASKAKAEEAKKETPPAPPTPEKKPSFFAGLFGKKPVGVDAHVRCRKSRFDTVLLLIVIHCVRRPLLQLQWYRPKKPLWCRQRRMCLMLSLQMAR